MRVSLLTAAAFGLTLAGQTPLAAEDYPNALAAEDDAVKLEPLAPWNIDYGQNRCRLARWFGTEDDVHMVMLEQAAPGTSFGLSLAGKEIRRFHSSDSIFLGLRGDRPMDERERFGRGSIDQVGKAIILSRVSIGSSSNEQGLRNAGVDLEKAATVDRIVVERRGRVLSFETGNMREPVAALNARTSNLLSEWGLDAEQHKAYVPPSWINEDAVTRRIVDQYPRQALNRGEQAIFRLRAIVEVDGSVSDCFIEESTRVERLESPACKEMRKAQFEPARSADGSPMRSYYATSITYAIR